MVVGLVGIVVPILPGLLLSYGAVLVWAIFADAGRGKWLVLGLATLWALIGTVVKYAWPGRRMKRAGIPNWTLLAGVAVYRGGAQGDRPVDAGRAGRGHPGRAHLGRRRVGGLVACVRFVTRCGRL